MTSLDIREETRSAAFATRPVLAIAAVVVLRLPAIAVTVTVTVTVAGVVFAARIAKELGGGRKAQILTAAAYACCGQFLGTGHYLATSTFDPFLWTVLLWVLTRWLRTRADGSHQECSLSLLNQ